MRQWHGGGGGGGGGPPGDGTAATNGPRESVDKKRGPRGEQSEERMVGESS
jgi:hypothetical protein